MPLSEQQIVQGLQVMRDFHNEPEEEVQRAVLDAAIERFGVCDCAESEALVRLRGVDDGDGGTVVVLPEIGEIQYCPVHGKRLEVPHADVT